MIAVAIASVPATITGEIEFGRMCETRIVRRRTPDGVRREHVVVLLLREHGPAQEPREDGDVHDPDGDHHVAQALPEHRDDRDREQKPRDREHDVHQPHHTRVGEPAEVAGNGTEDEADREPDRDGNDADQERVARAVHDSAEHVAALDVEPEQVLPRRRLRLEDPVDEEDVVGRVVRRDPGRADRCDHERSPRASRR